MPDSAVIYYTDVSDRSSQETSIEEPYNGVGKIKNDTLDTQKAYLVTIDALISNKTKLLKQKAERILLRDSVLTDIGQISSKVDTIEIKLPDVDLINDQLTEVNGLLDANTKHITDVKKSSWVDSHIKCLDKFEDELNLFEKKPFLNTEDISKLSANSLHLEQLNMDFKSNPIISQSIISDPLSNKAIPKNFEERIQSLREIEELKKQSESIKGHDIPEILNSTQHLEHEKLIEESLKKAIEAGVNSLPLDQEKLQSGVEKVNKFKKKYSKLPSSEDMGSGLKKSSLKEHSFKDRLLLGGNFHIKTRPQSVDISPFVGYKINKQFSIGIGGVFRANLIIDDFSFKNAFDHEEFGGRAFSQYQFWKGFLFHAEYEGMRRTATSSNSELADQKWIFSKIIGIGKEYQVTKGIKGQILILYRFIDDAKKPHNNSFDVRFGIIF